MAKSEYEANVEALQEAAAAARDAVRLVPQETRDPYVGTLDRLEHVLAYASVVLVETDGQLVSPQVHQALASAFGRVQGEVASQPQSAEEYSSIVLSALSDLPVAEGRLTAQEAKAAAKTFARSTQGRLTQLQASVESARGRADEVGEQVGAEREAFEQFIGDRRTEAEELVSGTRSQLEEIEQRAQAALTEQNEVFRKAQDERGEHFNASLEGFEGRLEEVAKHATERADGLIAELGRKNEDATSLLAALGVRGTAGRWAQEAKDQRKAANIWRWVTVGVVVAAVAAALFASRADSVDDPAFVSRTLVSLAFAGLAAYTARQSGRHRAREERARTLELELAAFGPFIESLPEERQHDQREKMVDRAFGRPPRETPLDGGPSLLGQLARPGERPHDDAPG